MKRLFIVGGGEMQVPLIEKAKQLGYFCVVSDFNSDAPGFKYANVVANISTTDFERTLELAKEYNVDGILTTSDYPVRTVAYVCENLGLSGPSFDAAKKCTDKFAQRSALEKGGFYVPKNFIVTSVEQIEKHKEYLAFPLVIKPVDSSASRGVRKVNTYLELLEAFGESVKYSNEKTLIIEEFVDGPEFSVEGLTQNGKTYIVAITEKGLGHEAGCFVESSHIIPAALSSEEEVNIQVYVEKVIQCLGIDNSSSHAELKLTSKGPVLIEIGARLGGDFITSDLVPLSTGVDMLENVINIALNQELNVKSTRSLYSGVRFLDPENYYRCKDLIDSENKNIVKYELKAFDRKPVTNSLERLGYIIATSEKRDILMKFLNI